MTTPPARRQVSVTRRETGRYTATNSRGGTLDFGSGQDEEFTPVELLLAAIGGCSAVDVDIVTARRAEADQFEVTISGAKVTDESGGVRLDDVVVDFTVRFDDDEEGRRAASMVERLVKLSRDKDCTVSRTVEHATDVEFRLEGTPLD
ncbi:OsmC family protein [Aestuariimicrobium ganziense]|uniref:OsmC family protein n=1 Tax=Aestuariimicrobium ganziense TaxID=2773677 RepID=UPI00194186A5|nr:OsmC family protein [Aestuariimicrobium ganziense]